MSAKLLKTGLKGTGTIGCSFLFALGMIATTSPTAAQEAAPEAAVEAAAPAAAVEVLTGEVNLPGLWIMTVETPDGAGSQGELTITEGDAGLAAVWVTDLGTATFESVSVDGNAISFGAEVDFGGVLVPIKFEGTTGGEKIAGTVSLEFDGQPLSLPATGVKGSAEMVAAAAVEAAGAAEAASTVEPLTGPVNLPGEWDFHAELPDGSMSTSAMTVTDEAGTLVALIQTELGEARINGIHVDGNAISFATEIDMGGVLVPLSFQGSTGGDKLQGAVSLNFEGQEMVLPITGERKGAGALTGEVNLPGLWDLAAELPDGSTSGSSLTVREEGGAIIAVLETEIGEATITGIQVDGNAVAFDTEIDMGGVMIPLSFEGSTGGDKLQGIVKLNMDGQEMALPISGTRTGDAPAEAAAVEAEAAPAVQ
jgi:hypothetical protein